MTIDVKENRNEQKAQTTLNNIKKIAKTDKNLIPYILKAVKNYCSVGEITDSLREVWGTYKEDNIF